MTSAALSLETPVGPVCVHERDGLIAEVSWTHTSAAQTTPLLQEAAHQLKAYFRGELEQFDLPLAPRGTAHQFRVWERMRSIPFGRTQTYGDLAAAVGSSARAVGTACGRNPIPIIIPCHRVVGAHNAPGGYSGRGGLATKKTLLMLEAQAASFQLEMQ